MASLKLAYNANGLRSLPLPAAIDAVAAHGYQGIELSLHPAHLDPFAVTAAELAAQRARLADRNLTLASLATGADTLLSPERFEPSLIAADAAGRRRRLDLLRRSIDLAQALGAPIVSLASGIRRPEVSPAQAFDWLVAGFEELIRHAAGELLLAVEPEPEFFLETNAQVLAAFDLGGFGATSGLALNQDIGHTVVCEDDPLASLTWALPRTCHIHVEDIAARVHRHLVPGEGDIDFAAVVARVAASGYDGFLAVELYDHGQDWQRALTASRAHLAPLLAAAGAPP